MQSQKKSQMPLSTSSPGANAPSGAELEELIRRLRVASLKVTEPRKAILKALLAAHGPFTAEQLHGLLPRPSRRVTCDLVTVYRCVASLEKAGLLRRCEFGDGMARYELAHGHEHHHHVICRSCRRVEPLEGLEICGLNGLDRAAQKKGFSDVSHSLEFFGVCPKCKVAS